MCYTIEQHYIPPNRSQATISRYHQKFPSLTNEKNLGSTKCSSNTTTITQASNRKRRKESQRIETQHCNTSIINKKEAKIFTRNPIFLHSDGTSTSPSAISCCKSFPSTVHPTDTQVITFLKIFCHIFLICHNYKKKMIVVVKFMFGERRGHTLNLQVNKQVSTIFFFSNILHFIFQRHFAEHIFYLFS